MEKDLLIKEPIDKVVMHYAENAKKAGLDGVVCSPMEARKVHSVCGSAKKIGSDYIVVGRPITAAEDPVSAYNRCIKEFCG